MRTGGGGQEGKSGRWVGAHQVDYMSIVDRGWGQVDMDTKKVKEKA